MGHVLQSPLLSSMAFTCNSGQMLLAFNHYLLDSVLVAYYLHLIIILNWLSLYHWACKTLRCHLISKKQCLRFDMLNVEYGYILCIHIYLQPTHFYPYLSSVYRPLWSPEQQSTHLLFANKRTITPPWQPHSPTHWLSIHLVSHYLLSMHSTIMKLITTIK